jgi:hypothetical protein
LCVSYRSADTEFEAGFMQLHKILLIAPLVIAPFALGTSATAQSAAGPSAAEQSIVTTREVLTNSSIITLAAAGFNEAFLIELIMKSTTRFDTSADGIASLAQEGITERVIRAMRNAPAGGAVATSGAKPITTTAEDAAFRISSQTPAGRFTPRFLALLRRVGIGAEPRAPSPLLPRLRVVSLGGVEIESALLPPAIQGLAYSANVRTSVNGRCPAGNVSLFLADGSLPRGLRTTGEGLAGVPQEMGLFRFWIGARNNCTTTTREFHLLVTGRPILRAAPKRIEFRVSPDSPPEGQTLLVSSTWPGLPYTLSSPDGSWLILRQAEGTTPEAGSALTGDRASVVSIPRKLAPGVHHGTVTVSAWRADPVTIEVTVTVDMPKAPPAVPPWITLSKLLQRPLQ